LGHQILGVGISSIGIKLQRLNKFLSLAKVFYSLNMFSKFSEGACYLVYDSVPATALVFSQ